MAPAAQVATGLGALALLVFVLVVIPVVQAALAPQLGTIEVNPVSEGQIDQYAETLAANHDFLDDRSPFFAPMNPANQVDPVEERVEVQPGAKYGGPKLTGILGDVAIFERDVTSDGRKELRVGESGREITLVRVLTPISVEVQWRGRNWPVSMFADGRIELEGAGGARPFDFRGNNTNRGNTLDLSGGGSSNGGSLFIPVEQDNQPSQPARPRSPAANN